MVIHKNNIINDNDNNNNNAVKNAIRLNSDNNSYNDMMISYRICRCFQL